VHYDEPYAVLESGYPIPACTSACPDSNPCRTNKGERPAFKVKIKNAGIETGRFGVELWDRENNAGLAQKPTIGYVELKPGEVSSEYTLQGALDYGAMPDHDWPLEIFTVRWDGKAETEQSRYPFVVCLKRETGDGYAITLNSIPATLTIDTPYTFTGTLTNSKGYSVSNQTISVYEDDWLWPNTKLVTGTTSATGAFSIPWRVRQVENWPKSDTAEFYACFRCGAANEAKSELRIAEIVTESLEWKMLALYGIAGVGVYTAGELLKQPAVKIASLIPFGLAGYEGYKMLKEQGWL